MTFNREFVPGATLGEDFQIFVNGNLIQVAEEEFEFDDADENLVTREVDVPLAMLVDGNNEVYADFVGNGGELVTAVLMVNQSNGDFSGNGVFDGEDLSLLVDQFGAAAADSPFDLLADGTVDMSDVDFWLESLRGTTVGLGDFDLDDDVDADDLATWQANYGVGTHYGKGDLDFDGDVDGIDLIMLQRLLDSSGTALATASIPEPTALLLGSLCAMCCLSRRW